ncbi:MAG: hypothetical protein QXH91_03645 [Candidatus Bathyarchaeia archaeon]
MMWKRLKAIGLFALAGFLLGIAANIIYYYAGPALVQIFPTLLEKTWLLWGLVGASISIVGCLVYAALPER